VDTLRYADAPPVKVDVLVHAPAAKVWELVSDIQLPARFSTEFQGADWLDSPGQGARFVGRSKHKAFGEWQTTCTITDYDPDHVFAWRVGTEDEPSARWRYSLEASGDSTLLTYWMRMGPGWSGLCVAIERMPDKESRIVARRLEEMRTNMAATIAGIRELAES
jgi:uncharacterized protein YndB with AHSA1/START domain